MKKKPPWINDEIDNNVIQYRARSRAKSNPTNWPDDVGTPSTSDQKIIEILLPISMLESCRFWISISRFELMLSCKIVGNDFAPVSASSKDQWTPF